MKRDTWPEDPRIKADQTSTGMTSLLCERSMIDTPRPTDFDAIPARTSQIPEIHAPINGGDRANQLLRPEVSVEFGECYSCGGHDSSFCEYCGRCSHCCDKFQCQYGCDFV